MALRMRGSCRSSSQLRAGARLFSVLAFLVAVGLLPGCQAFSAGNASVAASAPLHLVIDAGSSGTRLCLFRTERSCDAAGACACQAELELDCIRAPARDGLAALDANEARLALRLAFDQIHPDRKARIQRAALLGTGGFRQASALQRTRILTAADQELDRLLTESANDSTSGRPAIEDRASARVIEGAEEARLAWQAMRQVLGAETHRITETGGASVQYAAPYSYNREPLGLDEPGSPPLRSWSGPCGMNVVFDSLTRNPQFSVCYAAPGRLQDTDFAPCKALLQTTLRGTRFCGRQFLETQQAIGVAPWMGDRPLYGLGKPWQAVFAYGNTDGLTARQLERLGEGYCARRDADFEDEYDRRACYLLAFQSALLENLGADAIRNGGESWPRGAAADPLYFPRCGEE